VSQIDPAWQESPQQVVPAVPHFAHRLPLVHSKAFPHAELPQQDCMSPPQAVQVPPLPHRLPAAQVAPAQQG
jgi:hypothetical protein